MTKLEERILQNQTEIMWTLSYLLKSTKPNLVGNAGELDRMCSDLASSSKDTQKLITAAA